MVEALLVESVNLDMYALGQETGEKKVYIFDTFCLGITSTLYSILYNF